MERVLKYATQLARALAAAHAKDVVHRDLKPQNVLVDKSDQTLEKIGRALGANLLVRGTLQGAGDKMRIIVRLEDIADKKQVWTKEFDGATVDLFTLEDQIYGQLIAALEIQAALNYFEQALKADSRFALAYTGIADASLRMNSIKKDNLWTQKALCC